MKILAPVAIPLVVQVRNAIRRAEQVPDATRLAVLAQAGIPHEVQEQDEIPFGLWRLSAALFSVSLPERFVACVCASVPACVSVFD